MRGNTNKSPIKLNMQQKKIDTVICLQMRKTYTAKTSSSDFKVTTPENSLYQNKQLQVKESQYFISTYS